MKQTDANKFAKACDDEIASHHDNGHWEVVSRTGLPAATKVAPLVWAIRGNDASTLGKFTSGRPASTSMEGSRSMAFTVGKRMPLSCSGFPFECVSFFLSSRAGTRANSILYLPVPKLMWNPKSMLWRCPKASTLGASTGPPMCSSCLRTFMEGVPADPSGSNISERQRSASLCATSRYVCHCAIRLAPS
jgi:hypothetical protein